MAATLRHDQEDMGVARIEPRSIRRSRSRMIFVGLRPIQNRADACDQSVVVKGLAKIANDAIRQSARSNGVIGIGRDQDGWNGVAQLRQTAVEFNPRHARHMDVCDQAGGIADCWRSQEIYRRRESLDGEAQRPQEPGQSLSKRLIIIDDRYWSLCLGHSELLR